MNRAGNWKDSPAQPSLSQCGGWGHLCSQAPSSRGLVGGEPVPRLLHSQSQSTKGSGGGDPQGQHRDPDMQGHQLEASRFDQLPHSRDGQTVPK